MTGDSETWRSELLQGQLMADALIDAGYEIRLDAAAEDMRDSPSEVRMPLSTAHVGKPQSGKQYIQSVTLQLT